MSPTLAVAEISQRKGEGPSWTFPIPFTQSIELLDRGARTGGARLHGGDRRRGALVDGGAVREEPAGAARTVVGTERNPGVDAQQHERRVHAEPEPRASTEPVVGA